MVTVPIVYRLLNPLLVLPNVWHDKRIGHLRRYDARKLEVLFPGTRVLAAFYSGHGSKALSLLWSALGFSVDMGKVEERDRSKDHVKFGSSNLIEILQTGTS